MLMLVCGPFTIEAAERIAIGYVDLLNDPRHEDRTGFGGIVIEPRGRPHDGASLAMNDLAMVGQALGIEFELVAERAANADGVAGAIARLRSERGARFILLDAGAEIVTAAALNTRGSDVLLLNVSAEADALRGASCASHLLHLFPSTAMRTDALTQYIVARKWRESATAAA